MCQKPYPPSKNPTPLHSLTNHPLIHTTTIASYCFKTIVVCSLFVCIVLLLVAIFKPIGQNAFNPFMPRVCINIINVSILVKCKIWCLANSFLSSKRFLFIAYQSIQYKKWQDFWESSKPCHVGIHWIALSEYSQMSTHMPGFQSFSGFFAWFCFGQISHQQYKGYTKHDNPT